MPVRNPSSHHGVRLNRASSIAILKILVRSLWVVSMVALLSSMDARSQSYPPPQGSQSEQDSNGNPPIDCTDPRNFDSSVCTQSPSSNGTNGIPGSGDAGSSDSTGYGRQPLQNGVDGNETTVRRPGQQDGRDQIYTDDGGMEPNAANRRNRNNRQPLYGSPEIPEPPTEFQRLVKASTGQMLPIFGHELFRGAPSTFAPVDQIPVTSDYTVGPGDELLIRIWGQVSFNNRLTVDRTGSIYLPQVGTVHVAGLSNSELEPHLRAEIGRIFRNFELTVNLGQLRSIQVFVVGQVRHPGNYTISSFSTLINALFAAGGPQSRGSLRHILLKRGGKTVSDFDLYDLLLQGDKMKDSRLESGDVIFIPPVGPQIGVAGSVHNPAIYELKDATSVDQGLQMAGGLSTTASSSQLSLERIDEHRVRQAMSISHDPPGRDTQLQDGDVLRAIPLSARYEKSVTIRGNLANPGRFAWHAGMRLSDLMPDRESLLSNGYWERRNRLGSPNMFFADSQVDYARQAQRQGQNPQATGEESSNSSIATRQSTDANQNTTAQNATSQNGTNQNTIPKSTTVDVKLPAAEIDWSYAVIERLDAETLKNSLVPFNLGKLVIDHDASQDLPLQSGDIVTIFSQSDIRVPLALQTKYVKLEGEFGSAGVYSVLPGETLRQLVVRAGGLTANAYLYGSDFTRESTRVIQQRRLDEYISSLAIQIERDSSSRTAAAVSLQDAASVNGALAGQRQIVARLRTMRSTGRIVLELKANSADVDALPDLALEDGDEFVVPSPPASVNVVGAVYDQSSFLFNRSRRVHDYLRLAGGFTRSADSGRAFIVRADGSVLSRQSTTTLWGNNFQEVPLNPGDTIVIPEKLFRLSTLRGLQDWSQVLSNFALGAAALNVIR